ncbi:hemolysin family protein [Candidatus Sumerlaeota bacterium]
MLGLVIAICVAVFVSAACSLFEAVLYSIPLSAVEALAATGHRSGKVLRELRRQIDRPISAILSLNTIANTAGAAAAGYYAGEVFGSKWLGLFSAVFTFVILIFSEVIPKTAGVVYCRALGPWIAWPVQWLVWTLAPAIWLCRASTHLVRRGDQGPRVSEEELIMMTKLGLQTGEIARDEAQVIQNILSLESKAARDVMTPRTVMFAFDADSTVADAREQLTTLVYTRIPVFAGEPEDIVGFVHRRDAFAAIAEGRQELTFNELMRPVHFVQETLALDRLLRMFLEHRQHMVIVVDEFGQLAGLVTLEDVLEEILGKEIVDELDQVTDLRELAHRRRKDILGGPADAGKPAEK